MIETSYSHAREQLKSLMDRVIDDRETVLIKRRSGGDVAMIAAEELESLLETAHLLRSPKNTERLLTAMNRARNKTPDPVSLDDLRQKLKPNA